MSVARPARPKTNSEDEKVPCKDAVLIAGGAWKPNRRLRHGAQRYGKRAAHADGLCFATGVQPQIHGRHDKRKRERLGVTMKEEYIRGIYAGWLAKIIGVRCGAPIEGWDYEKIRNIFGELDGYPADYKQFAADDDTNGPVFLLRALEDGGHGRNLTAQDVGEALLNYAPFEHGFFWWGGYGVSTEHTAYLNLFNGIPAPRSGSIAQNGKTMAEQIGGQIFIDAWGLVAPGDPDLAARLAGRAASVTHGGNGVYGGIFVAVCISYAFVEKDIPSIIKKGLSYLPPDCEYARAVRAVMDFHAGHPEDWRACYRFIKDNFGYDRYPGNCHIIPNISVMILGLLYGDGDFSKTLCITDMCGWDTDCNVGNVATIIGVRNGPEGIPYDKWRKPVDDLFICSSVIGSLNILDVPSCAAYTAKQAYALSGENIPDAWKTILTQRPDSCHFEFPGSTHSIRIRRDLLQDPGNQELESRLWNTDESAHTGARSLKFMAKPLRPAEKVLLYKKTYYQPQDFSDSRYDPSFSPLIYPGMTLHGSVMVPRYGMPEPFVSGVRARLYVHELHKNDRVESEPVVLKPGAWSELSWKIPAMDGALLDEMGVCFDVSGQMDLTGFLDDLYADGAPDYTVDFAGETEEVWNGLHREISQFTRLKGLQYLEDGKLHISCADFAESYTGRHDWGDYAATFGMTPQTGEHHYVNVRVQGAMRSYAAGFLPDGKLGLLKKQRHYRLLAQTDYPWEPGREYAVTVAAVGNRLSVRIDGVPCLAYTDCDDPFLTGSVGVSVENGSHTKYSFIKVRAAG